jgi:hypothetical protein
LAALALAGVAVACVPAAFAQDSDVVRDSIIVGDRRAPRGVWAVVASPFSGWVQALRRFHGSLEARGVRVWATAQGPNSGIGPELRLGPARPSLWLHGHGAVTVRGYWQVDARAGARLPRQDSPVSLEAAAAFEDRPKDVFFGIGNASRAVDRSDYSLRRWTVGGRVVVRVREGIALGVGVDWMRAATGPGGDDAFPDVDSTFMPSQRPGFHATQRYVSFGGSAEWIAGPRHSTARTGSWVMVAYRWRASRTAGMADAGLASASAGLELPFHLLPAVGGPQSLPALRAERYRDREALVTKLEYRDRVWSGRGDVPWVDAVLFTSYGMVAGRLGDQLATRRLHGSTGVAFALITRTATVARLAVAHGAEGLRVTLAFGPTF